jgi:hypothetical protein
MDDIGIFGSSFNDPQTLGILGMAANMMQAGGPSRMPISTGQALGQGLLGRIQGYQSGMSMQEQAMKLDVMKRQLAMQQALGEALKSQQEATQGGQQSITGQEGIPGIKGAQSISAPTAADVMMNAAMKAGDMSAYQEALKMKIEEKKLNPKFATEFRVGKDAQGNIKNYMLNDAGQAVESPVGNAEKMNFQDVGGGVVGLNPYTGQPGSSFMKSQSPDAVANRAQADAHFNTTQALDQQKLGLQYPMSLGNQQQANLQSGLNGEEFLKTIPVSMQPTIKAIAEGRMAVSPMMARTPQGQSLLAAVTQYDPTFDQIDFNARNKTRQGFTSGKEAATVNSLNTLAGHLGDLQESANALNNSSLTPLNSVLNYVEDKTGDPRLKNFNTAKDAVTGELVKAFNGGHITDAELKQYRENLDSASSPQQLQSVIQRIAGLVQSKTGALEDQYKKGMGLAENAGTFLSPKAQEVYQKILGNSFNKPENPRNILGQQQTSKKPDLNLLMDEENIKRTAFETGKKPEEVLADIKKQLGIQ